MDRFTNWDEQLQWEHKLIERAISVLRKQINSVSTSSEDQETLVAVINFLLDFGDRVHNYKEEKFLCPLMEDRGIPVLNGPLGVMLGEHEIERSLLQEMLHTATILNTLPVAQRTLFVQEVKEYIRKRSDHLWTENDVFYAMGRKVLEEADNLTLLRQFKDMDTRSCDEYAAMMSRLEK